LTCPEIIGTISKDMKLGKVGFFNFVLLCSLVLISAYVVGIRTGFNSEAKRDKTQEITFNLTAGWNGISIPFEANLMASGLCKLLPTTGVQIHPYSASGWQPYYTCSRTDQIDFKIVPYDGYMVVVPSPVAVTISGTDYPFTGNLSLGLDYVGFDVKGKNFQAKDVCKKKISDTVSVVGVQRGVKGTGNAWTWEKYDCKSPVIASFKINSGEAYFVNTEEITKPVKRVKDPGVPIRDNR
jgi:hypothetical protein